MKTLHNLFTSVNQANDSHIRDRNSHKLKRQMQHEKFYVKVRDEKGREYKIEYL